MAAEVEAIGISVETGGVERGIRSLDELASRGPKVEKSMRGIESAASDASKGISTLGNTSGKGLDELGKAGER